MAAGRWAPDDALTGSIEPGAPRLRRYRRPHLAQGRLARSFLPPTEAALLHTITDSNPVWRAFHGPVPLPLGTYGARPSQVRMELVADELGNGNVGELGGLAFSQAVAGSSSSAAPPPPASDTGADAGTEPPVNPRKRKKASRA